jgi:hypothetical protein
MTFADTPLFEETYLKSMGRPIIPQIVIPGDTARTRRTDKATSHRAADRSAATLKAVKLAVIQMVEQKGPVGGSELNRLYQVLAESCGWPLPLHFDSPRKRASELAADGFLTIVNEDHPRGTETEYVIPDTAVRA